MYNHLTLWQARATVWFASRAHGAYAKAWLFFLSFTESSFLFIPPDILLVAILLVGSREWFYYALLTTIASVLGAVFGYAIALFFFDTVGIRIVEFYQLTSAFEGAKVLFSNNAFWLIFTAAFTPIPYKIFVLGAGFFKINFFIFLVASILGRGLRYLVVAYATRLFGERATSLLSRYSTAVTLAIVVIAVTFIVKSIFF